MPLPEAGRHGTAGVKVARDPCSALDSDRNETTIHDDLSLRMHGDRLGRVR
jgi:hypothetical protein